MAWWISRVLEELRMKSASGGCSVDVTFLSFMSSPRVGSNCYCITWYSDFNLINSEVFFLGSKLLVLNKKRLFLTITQAFDVVLCGDRVKDCRYIIVASFNVLHVILNHEYRWFGDRKASYNKMIDYSLCKFLLAIIINWSLATWRIEAVVSYHVIQWPC